MALTTSSNPIFIKHKGRSDLEIQDIPVATDESQVSTKFEESIAKPKSQIRIREFDETVP